MNIANITLFTVLLTFIFSLWGCAKDKPQDRFDNYLYRLNNSLDVPSASLLPKSTSDDGIKKKTLPRYPQKKQLKQQSLGISINLLDFCAYRAVICSAILVSATVALEN